MSEDLMRLGSRPLVTKRQQRELEARVRRTEVQAAATAYKLGLMSELGELAMAKSMELDAKRQQLAQTTEQNVLLGRIELAYTENARIIAEGLARRWAQ